MAPPRVLITRAAHQSSALAEELRALGCEPILLPTIELAPPTSYCALDAALTCLNTYDWLVFTSANAVEAFHARHLALKGTAFRPSGTDIELDGALAPQGVRPRIASIGPATARALAGAGIPPTLVPPQAVAESLAAALVPHAGKHDGTPARFLLLRAEQARDVLPDALTAAGAHVSIAAVYRTVIPAGSIERVQTLFATNPPDAITFTSGSTVTNLLALLEAAHLTLPTDTLRISIGPITSQTLRDADLPPHAESPEATIPALAATVVHALIPGP